MTTSDIYVKWKIWFPLIHADFFKNGVFDTTPLLNLLENTIVNLGNKYGAYFKRMISVMAMDANTGILVNFDDKNTKFLDFPMAAKASASIPELFGSVKIGDHVFFDGSL